jgi:drug/metabolite transporter (DMT)-like permease
MSKIVQIALIVVAASSVAIADVLIKKAAFHTENFWEALKSPILLAAIALYIVQMLVFLYVFVHKAELGIVGIIQMVLYAIIVIGAGVLFFQEDISLLQGIGIGIALVGVILMNI